MSKKQTQIILPRVYTKELWEIGGKREYSKQFIGKPYVSWSQIESFNDRKGFNTGFKGSLEWILKYLLGYDFPDLGWGEFGNKVEDYICNREHQEMFSDSEKVVLDSIKPLGIFQREITLHIKELDFIVLGYIDDMELDGKKVKTLRDYKTKSKSSKADLHDDKKHQIEIYTWGLEQEGYEVESAEYVVIERLGGRECMMGGGVDSLSVGNEIWYEPYAQEKLGKKRREQTEKLVIKTAKKMSELYKTFNKYFATKQDDV